MKKAIIFLVLLLFPFLVNAKVTEFGDNVDVKGEYDSTIIIAGNNVKNESKIDGIGLVFGNNIIDKGTVDYGAYAGNTLLISGNYQHDLFAAGSQITVEKEAVITRDAYLAAGTIIVRTNIGRNLYAGAEEVDLSGIKINGDAYIMADKIIMDKETEITGKLSYSEDSNVEGLDIATIHETKIVKNNYKEEKSKKKVILSKVKDWFTSLAIEYVSLIIVLFIFPKLREKIDNEKLEAGNIFKKIGIGFVLLVVVPIVCIIGLVTVILIPISLLSICVYLFSLYFGSLLTYYYTGKKVYSLIKEKSNWLLESLIGVVLFKLIKLIPVIDGLLGFVALIFGMGLLFTILIEKAEKKVS